MTWYFLIFKVLTGKEAGALAEPRLPGTALVERELHDEGEGRYDGGEEVPDGDMDRVFGGPLGIHTAGRRVTCTYITYPPLHAWLLHAGSHKIGHM